jgi:glucokinase
MTDVAIAMDIGGTGIKCALIDREFQTVHTERHATGAERGPDAVVETILTVAAGLADTARAAGHHPIAAGLAAPGVIDEANGVAVWSANVGFRGVPLRDLVTERLHLPAAIGHDVRAGARAEAALGAGQGARRSWFIAIGTGIAAAYVIDGRTDPGAHGSSGEIGHVRVRPDGPVCGCGQRGCLEAIASASAVARRHLTATGQPASAAEIVALATAGDAAASAVWAETIDVLADGLLIGVTLYDPDVIIVGGGLAEARDRLLDPVAATLSSRLTFQTMPAIRHAALGDEAGCLGAALLAFDALDLESR